MERNKGGVPLDPHVVGQKYGGVGCQFFSIFYLFILIYVYVYILF